MEFVLSADIVCSTDHQPCLHADSLKMHTQTWRCMQTAYKFDVEQTKPSVSHCFTEMNFRTNWTTGFILIDMIKKHRKLS